MQANTHVVLRSFSGPAGHEFTPGEHINAEAWRTRASLEDRRYIRRMTPRDLEASGQQVPAEALGIDPRHSKGGRK